MSDAPPSNPPGSHPEPIAELLRRVGEHETELAKLAAEAMSRQQQLQRTLAELERARRAAETASRVKSNLLRMMSHELKTPITAMQLNVRVLEEDPDVQASPRLRDGLERIARSSRRLTHLVDTALYWARAESGRSRVAIAPFDLSLVACDVERELAPYAAQKGIELEVDAPALAPLSSDRRLARLLCYILLERAIQVTERGSVSLHLSCDHGYHRVAVSDSASPIDREEEQTLFDPLPLGDLHQRSGHGSGLGLYVVRDLVRTLGGEVTLSARGVGNLFTMMLPSSPAEDSAPSWREGPPSWRDTRIWREEEGHGQSQTDERERGNPPTLAVDR